MKRPLVTIGIPTFNRPTLLARALRAVQAQDYPNLEVLVADNASPGDEVTEVVTSFERSVPSLRYTRHPHNIGSFQNFMFLLASANGEYFMWLADDDEISADYVSALAQLLDEHPDAAAAAGHWVLMENEREGRRMPTSSFPQTTALVRALRFIWSSDDAFFYALHRTQVLRTARFRGYAWPNRDVLLNWAYVYLLDIVLRGRVLLTDQDTATFINHDYTPKHYEGSRRWLAGAFRRTCRRFNVHFLYWEKCARLLNPVFIPLVAFTSLGSLLREAGAGFLRRSRRALQRSIVC